MDHCSRLLERDQARKYARSNGPGQYINTGWRRRVGEGKTTGRREIFALGIFNGQLNAYDKNVVCGAHRRRSVRVCAHCCKTHSKAQIVTVVVNHRKPLECILRVCLYTLHAAVAVYVCTAPLALYVCTSSSEGGENIYIYLVFFFFFPTVVFLIDFQHLSEDGCDQIKRVF